MNLLDGLNYYKQDSSLWKFTLDIENSANEVLKLVALYSDRPHSAALAAAYALLEDIELSVEVQRLVVAHGDDATVAGTPAGNHRK
jgi:phage-related baseplate assembly protein